MKSTKTLKEKIEVMKHCLNGGKIIIEDEYLWDCPNPPVFNWEENDYSIYEEPKTKPSINWEHVDKKFKYMATDEDRDTYLYEICPEVSKRFWIGDCEFIRIEGFSSFTSGTCNWKDSLVVRPE